MTKREEHVALIAQLEVYRDKAQGFARRDLDKHIGRLKKELDIYDYYHRKGGKPK